MCLASLSPHGFSPANELTFQRSSSIAAAPSGRYLAAVNSDSNTISLISLPDFDTVVEIPVGPNPQTLSIDPTSRWIAVANRDDDSVSILDMAAGRVVSQLPTGDEPFGVVVSPDAFVYVTCAGTTKIEVFDLLGGHKKQSLEVEPHPRGLIFSSHDKRLYVTHFQTGRVSIIDSGEFRVRGVISTGADSNLLQGLWLDAASGLLYLPHTRSNSSNRALLFDTTVFPVVSVVDINKGLHLSAGRLFLDLVDRPVSLPLDAAITSDRRLFVLNAGSNDLSVIDLGSRKALAHVEVGQNPRGMALSPDERHLYVNNSLSATVTVVETSTYVPVREFQISRIPLPDNILRGKILFNTSARPEMAKDQWISCATCHFDGHMDGRTWFFRDGPRNTTSLFGVGETLPLHWSGDLDELQDVEETIRKIQVGTGLAPGPSHCEPACDQGLPNAGRSSELEDLAAYMRTLDFPPNPNLNAGGALTSSALRGGQIFFSRKAGCADCHVPPFFADGLKHDVGTGRNPLETKGTFFDTPTIRGVYQTAPYLHDGSAATLLEVLTIRNPQDLHGRTSHLSQGQLTDLVEFIKSVPFDSDHAESVVSRARPGSGRVRRTFTDR